MRIFPVNLLLLERLYDLVRTFYIDYTNQQCNRLLTIGQGLSEYKNHSKLLIRSFNVNTYFIEKMIIFVYRVQNGLRHNR